MKTLTTQKSIICLFGIEICLSNDFKGVVRFQQQREAFSVSDKKIKRCSFGTYSFLTHGHFVSLRNFFLVSNKAMKTLTTQKSIIWSERPWDRP